MVAHTPGHCSVNGLIGCNLYDTRYGQVEEAGRAYKDLCLWRGWMHLSGQGFRTRSQLLPAIFSVWATSEEQRLDRPEACTMANLCNSGYRCTSAVLAQLLMLLLLVLSLWWLLLWWLFPTKEWSVVIEPLYTRMDNKAYGEATYYMFLFTGIAILIAMVAALYLHVVSPRAIQRVANNWFDEIVARGRPRVSVWSYPVLTRSYLGVVSAADLTFIIFMVALTCWTVGYWTDLGIKEYVTQDWLDENKITRNQGKLLYAALIAGFGIIVPFGFVFLPVSRGSVLLRLVNIPFEHAVKYHKWAAFIMMVFTIGHAALIYAYWAWTDKLHEWKLWQHTGINYLSGTLAGVVGLAIMVTSWYPVRTKFFEVFFGFHQLYVLWVVFSMIHLGEWTGFMWMGYVFIFMLDRVLRFIQSRKEAGIISVRCLPGDTIELVFAKHPGLEYTAAAFVFVQIPALSWWQWHPFTMASSSLVEKDRITILVKRAGGWTTGLERLAGVEVDAHGDVMDRAASDGSPTTTTSRCPFGIKAAVEGPYGHEDPYFLRYDTLMFVAGGSGIAPFISILKDLMHRYSTHTGGGETGKLPTDVTLVWAVRKADELQILNRMTFPDVPHSSFNLRILGFVTRQQVADPEDVVEKAKQGVNCAAAFNSDGRLHPICPEVAKDSNLGHFLVLTAAVMGLLLAWALFVNYITGPDYDDYSSWLKAMWFLLACAVGVGFGAATVLAWTSWVQPQLYRPPRFAPTDTAIGYVAETEMTAPNASPTSAFTGRLLDSGIVQYGSRPDVHALFNEVEKRLAGRNAHVGVLVCGPLNLQQTVAEECQSHSSLFGSPVAFHYHSVSFDF